MGENKKRDYKKIPLNANISPKDERDYLISRLISPTDVFPQEFELYYNHPIKNQEDVGSCVAHSLAYCKEIIEEKQKNEYNKFSVGYVYGNRKEDDYQGEGMYPRQALNCLIDYGNVFYNLFPYNEVYPLVNRRINNDAEFLHLNASPYKITAYCRLYSIVDIKNAIMNLGPVTISYPIHEGFFNTGVDGIVPSPIEEEQYYGNHMMTIIGWKVFDNVERWIVLNSWGKEWGHEGKCYIATDVSFTEAWSITDSIIPDSINKKTVIMTIGKSYYFINGEKFIMDTVPIIKNSRTFVPVRVISESLGAQVDWGYNEKGKIRVIITYKGNKIVLNQDEKIIYKNGKPIILDVATFVNTDNRTMIPIRGVVEILGGTIEWIESEQKVVFIEGE